jgi:hypothetical protein
MLAAPRIRHAGSVFIGPYSPEAAGDYASGPNHVLPTGGAARIRGGLSVTDFVKVISVQELTPRRSPPGARHHHAGPRRRTGSARPLRGSEGQMRLAERQAAIKPRPAVQQMAPYSPPTGGRAGKLRLDFNENTVGCSPRVIDASAAASPPTRSPSTPNMASAKQAIAAYFHVKPEQFVFTNGTDEAIQVFINTYVDDGQEVLVLKPAYAMYRFYAEVAGAKIKRGRLPAARPWNSRCRKCSTPSRRKRAPS